MTKEEKTEITSKYSITYNYNQLPNDDDQFNHLDFISQILWSAIVNKTKTDITNDKFIKSGNKYGCTFPYNYAEKIYGSNISRHKFTNAIKELEEAGYLMVERESKKGFCNRYYPIMPETKNERKADELFEELPTKIKIYANKITDEILTKDLQDQYYKFPRKYIQTYKNTYDKLSELYGKNEAVDLFCNFVDSFIDGSRRNLKEKFNFNTIQINNPIFKSFIKDQDPKRLEDMSCYEKSVADGSSEEITEIEEKERPTEDKTVIAGKDVSEFTGSEKADFKKLVEEYPDMIDEIYKEFTSNFSTYFSVKLKLEGVEREDGESEETEIQDYDYDPDLDDGYSYETEDDKLKYILEHPEVI